jgi:hypothetical protein
MWTQRRSRQWQLTKPERRFAAEVGPVGTALLQVCDNMKMTYKEKERNMMKMYTIYRPSCSDAAHELN